MGRCCAPRSSRSRPESGRQADQILLVGKPLALRVLPRPERIVFISARFVRCDRDIVPSSGTRLNERARRCGCLRLNRERESLRSAKIPGGFVNNGVAFAPAAATRVYDLAFQATVRRCAPSNRERVRVGAEGRRDEADQGASLQLERGIAEGALIKAILTNKYSRPGASF